MPDLDAQVDHIEDDVLRLDLPVLPPLPDRRVPGRADAAPGRRPHHRRDRPRVPGHRGHDGPAHLAREEDAGRGARRVRAADRAGADRAPRRRHGRDLPDLQRGLHRHRRRGLDAPGAGERGDAARAHAGRARARRARGARAAGAAGDPGLADAGPSRRGRRAGPARGAGPDTLGPVADPARAGRAAAGRGARRARDAGREVLPPGLDRRPARPRSARRRTRTGAGSPRSTTFWPTPHPDRSSRSTGQSRTAGRSARTPGSPCWRRRPLGDSPLVPSVRGDLLERAGRHAEASEAFSEAAGRTKNEGERAVLQRRAEQNRTPPSKER